MSTTVAVCHDCGSEHPLGARDPPASPDDVLTDDGVHLSTTCPDCGSPSYHTNSTSDGLTEQQVGQLLRDTHGVGDETFANIRASFGNLTLVPCTPTDELTAVDGVGVKTAERIKQRVDG